MKKYIFRIGLAVLLIMVIASCSFVTPVSKSERLSMFVADLNAGRYSGLPDHFSESNMGGGWNSVTTPTYWTTSNGWDNAPFSYSISSTSSTTITAIFSSGAPDATMIFYFVEDGSDSFSEVWKIYRVDKDGSTILQ